jgi:SagB-type dehydrogenase family enzyme
MPGYLPYLKNQPSPGAPGFVSDQLKGTPAPAIEKPPPEGAVLIDLVQFQDLTPPQITLFEAIQKRRTRRLFSESPLSWQELSLLLWSTQGIQHLVRGGTITLRTVPSGGGMHPFETYLLVNRVENLEPGLYRYLAVEHALFRMAEVVGLNEKLVQACNNQDYISNGAVVFLWAARPYRSEWRNAENALKDILISAGHICQNLYLVCEGIQVGVSPIITYQQALVDDLVGVDGENELVVYLATIGKIDTSVIQL